MPARLSTSRKIRTKTTEICKRRLSSFSKIIRPNPVNSCKAQENNFAPRQLDPSLRQSAVPLNKEEQWTHIFGIFIEIFDLSSKSQMRQPTSFTHRLERLLFANSSIELKQVMSFCKASTRVEGSCRRLLRTTAFHICI